MDGFAPTDVALLVGGGLVAGVVNTLAGGGSLLTVPLLVLIGLPGTLANGTNRVGIVLQCLAATWRFRAEGVFEPRSVLRVLAPVVAGALLGAFAAARLADAVFERIFGVLMLALLVPTLRQLSSQAGAPASGRGWRPATAALVFFGIGLYAGALQAGVGLPLLFALIHSGHDVVRANAIKVAVVAAATLTAVPVFAQQGQIAWAPALLLAVGFSAGGVLGARVAVRGGARLIRPVLALAVVALAARMLGLY
jgi:uncharacterized membrane protein YfcA